MAENTYEMRILRYVGENGPQRFNNLLNNEEIRLSRGTVNKYLKILRENNWIDTKWEDDKKWNFITPEGRLQLERRLGRDNLVHRLKAYGLFEKKIKDYRDEFLDIFGHLPNSLLMDCLENLLDFEEYGFHTKIPQERFKFFFAFFLARFNIQYCKSEEWRRVQPAAVQLSQDEYCKKYKLDIIELKYFFKQWAKSKIIYSIPDKKGQLWFLDSGTFLYHLMMDEIYYRTRRGTLQEVLFENFIFNASNEASKIVQNVFTGSKLTFDFGQIMWFQNFVRRMIEIFLEKRKKYKKLWINLPRDPDSLVEMAINLEMELNEIKEDSPRYTEILKALHYISAHLKNDKEAILWGERYIEKNPEDLSMLTLMAQYYFQQKQYSEFLTVADKLNEILVFDFITNLKVLEYYIDVKPDLDKALGIIEDAERMIANNYNLEQFIKMYLPYKARVYSLLEDLNSALVYARRAWVDFDNREREIFNLIVGIFKIQEDWESLEDFCLNTYYEDEHNPEIFSMLYFAHLKRDSKTKAELLYDRTKQHYPEYLKALDDIKNELSEEKK